MYNSFVQWTIVVAKKELPSHQSSAFGALWVIQLT